MAGFVAIVLLRIFIARYVMPMTTDRFDKMTCYLCLRMCNCRHGDIAKQDGEKYKKESEAA